MQNDVLTKPNDTTDRFSSIFTLGPPLTAKGPKRPNPSVRKLAIKYPDRSSDRISAGFRTGEGSAVSKRTSLLTDTKGRRVTILLGLYYVLQLHVHGIVCAVSSAICTTGCMDVSRVMSAKLGKTYRLMVKDLMVIVRFL